MKNFSFLIALITILIAWVPMQSQTYHLSVSNETFEFLENGTPAVTESWDDPEFIAPLGFSFEFFDEMTSNLYNPDFYTGGTFSTNLDVSALDVILPFSVDLVDRGYNVDSFMSPIIYKTEGAAGNRIFTLEYNNSGFYSGLALNDIYIDFINLQLKLYEESGDIEVHIGPYSLAAPEFDFDGLPGPTIGLAEDLDLLNSVINGEIILLSGDPLNPDIVTDPSSGFVTWPIPAGTVYRFSKTPSAVSDPKATLVSDFYYPNPSNEFVTLKPEFRDAINSPVYVINNLGEIVRTDNDPGVIELDRLSEGIYTLNFFTNGEQVSQRISLIK